jgi:hypothetical protein
VASGRISTTSTRRRRTCQTEGVSDTGSAITGAAGGLGSGVTAIAQVGAGGLILLVGFLLVTGLSKAVTRTAGRVVRTVVPAARLVR